MNEKIKEIKRLLDIVKVTDWSQIGDRVDEIKLMFDDLEKPKRKPLEDGTLPLTDGELKEFFKMTEYYSDEFSARTVSLNAGCIIFDMCKYNESFGWMTVNTYKAILYLAERFDLTEK